MNSSSAATVCQYINKNAAFEVFVDFGAVQPFKGVDLPSVCYCNFEVKPKQINFQNT
jgi:hypothetical protein